MQTIGILIFDDVEELDFVGPLEVFGMAARLGADCRILLVAEHAGPIRCRYALRTEPDVSFETCPSLDLLLVPGGPGASGAARNSPSTLDFIRKHTGPLASVCTGALVLAAAGVLAGRHATTHYS